MKRKTIFILTVGIMALMSCNAHDRYLNEALKAAGDNRHELEKVLEHYKEMPLELKAARYIIENLPGHYSYDTARTAPFYRDVLAVLKKDISADSKRDSIRFLSENKYRNMMDRHVEDVKVISSEYLIHSIDHAFKQWRERPWAQHLGFDEFCEFLLPYKLTDGQELDYWRDTLSMHFSDNLNRIDSSDFKQNSANGALDIFRNELAWKLNVQVRWTDYGGYGLKSASVMPYMATGSCYDYVVMGTLAFRSVGLPVCVDMVPLWGRNHEGHTWYVLLNDRGMQMPARNDITTQPGGEFYPYERFPKIWRLSYEINRRTKKYLDDCGTYKFDPFLKDVTDLYYKTSDLKIPLHKGYKVKEKYAYIAMFSVTSDNSWQILDFGKVKNGYAYFDKMGRNMQYIVLVYENGKYIPASDPFIVYKDGSVRIVHSDMNNLRSVDVKRKYFQSYNVVNMRKRILGAQLQCANKSDFSDAQTLYTINTTDIPDKIHVKPDKPYRYWRYMSADGTNGSIAELGFFLEDGTELSGEGIACSWAAEWDVSRAFDHDWLSNFETWGSDGNWVGMDMGTPKYVTQIRVVPRSDDNDIHPGQEYELRYIDSRGRWRTTGIVTATDNVLHYDSIPSGCFLWLINHTTGLNERPFLINEDGTVEWW